MVKTFIKKEEPKLIHREDCDGFSSCRVEITNSENSFCFLVKIYGLISKETWFAIDKKDLKELERLSKKWQNEVILWKKNIEKKY